MGRAGRRCNWMNSYSSEKSKAPLDEVPDFGIGSYVLISYYVFFFRLVGQLILIVLVALDLKDISQVIY